MTGVRGNREIFDRRPIIGSLVFECTKLDDLKAGSDAPREDVVGFSGDEAQVMEQRCGAGKAAVAVAVHFRAGSSVDAIALECINVL